MEKKRVKRSRAGVLAAAGAAVLAGGIFVSTSGSGARSASVEIMVPDVSEFPLRDRSADDAKQYKLVFDATDKLLGECMSSKGHRWLPSGNGALPATSPFGLTSGTAAAARGYRQSEAVEALLAESDALKKAADAAFEGLDTTERASFIEDLVGPSDTMAVHDTEGSQRRIPTRGCRAEVADALTGGQGLRLAKLESDVGALAATARSRAASDVRTATAVDSWATCMSRAGFPEAKSPFEMARAFMAATATRSVSQISLAVADVECKSSSKFVETYGQVLIEHQQALASENESSIADYERLVNLTRSTAASVLGR